MKGAPKGSIEAEEFKAFKSCIEELQFMNEQYNKFKQNTKANKNKSEKFMNFYKKCKQKNKNASSDSVSESEESVADIKSYSNRIQLIEKCRNMLPHETPNDLDSVKSEDFNHLANSPGQDNPIQVILS